MSVPSNPVPDQAQRDAAVAERRRNVVIDAGAGTGKTTILVERLIRIVAPVDQRIVPIPISRIAAVTFTRRAAGELRLRVRERLLQELSRPDLTAGRQAALHGALAALDTAHIGTIHSFADRLLRQLPAEARLSPAYEIAEDGADLVRETFTVLLQSAQEGTLAAQLAETPVAERAIEAQSTLLDALRAGLRAESQELRWVTLAGIDGLIEGFVMHRDVPPPDPPLAKFEVESFRRYAEEFLKLAAPIRGMSPGQIWFQRSRHVVGRLVGEMDPAVVYREVEHLPGEGPRRESRNQNGFGGDRSAWKAWKIYTEGKERGGALRDDLLGPLHRWLAHRLVRLFPVVHEIYERVKARYHAVDQIDLLLKLRNLMVGNRDARRHYQALFDHVLVDEFQDTDPLQAEVILFLCEREPRAHRWDAVMLADGKLTIVGDPKQSIYRFRRADVAMYDRVRQLIRKSFPLEVRLSANFRSAPRLVDWYNDRLEHVLEKSPDGRTFEVATGKVFHAPLLAGRDEASGGGKPCVHVLPFELAAGEGNVDDYRALEAAALARYLRWLVERSGVEIADPVTDERRSVAYGDIAVLALVTTNLPLLFRELERMAVPYSARGGKLFLQDPLHRQFLLGLRAIADSDDGIAEAALLRPPFFAVDPLDVLRARRKDGAPDERGREAIEWVRDLRRRRFSRSPGATARDLLEGSAFGRMAALRANGTQRLLALREICLVLEHLANREGLDFDGATARLRGWLTHPIQLDPPYPVGEQAVQVMTVHQAKGLEFPVVVLWDGKASWKDRNDQANWRVERDGRGWQLALEGLNWEEPPGSDLAAIERKYREAERRRVVYVAATRARDLLVLSKAGQPKPSYIQSTLLGSAVPGAVRELETYFEGKGAPWANEFTDPEPFDGSKTTEIDRQIADRWRVAAAEAARPRFRAVGVAGDARLRVERDLEAVELPKKHRAGRYGAVFGETVHRAIASVMNAGVAAELAVKRAAAISGLQDHMDEAAGDVARAVDALRVEGLLRPVGESLRLEYPLAGPGDGGKLLAGYADLVSATERQLDIVDFKTDQPPRESTEAEFPEYAEQVRTYARLLIGGGVRSATVRCGLLFTAEGRIRWLADARDRTD